MKKTAIVTLLLIAFSLIHIQSALGQESEKYRFITKWGSQTNNAVLYAGKLATDPSGNLYVIRGGLDLTPVGNAEVSHLMIVKYDPTGLPMVQFGPYGEGFAELSSPSSVAADATGQFVYVSDMAGKILKFKSDGTFVKQWGSRGSGDGQFSQYVQGLAIDREGNVYVADAGNARVQKFSPEGKFLEKWGSDGSEDGQFSFPYGMAVGPDGSVYVDDLGNRRIQKFSPEGKFILKWTPGGGDPIGIAVDSQGSVYVVPQSSGMVKKFTANGQFITEFNGTTLEPAYLYSPIDVAVDGDGNIYTGLQNAGVQKFDKDGKYLASYSITKEGINGFRSPMGIAVDSIGHIYVLDGVDMRIQKFTNLGDYVLGWQFAISSGESAYDIAADNKGNIYLVWEGVKIFTAEGASIGRLKDTDGEEINGARAIAINNDFIYVASGYKIQKFSLDGEFVSEWQAGDTGEQSGQNIIVDDIAVDSEGKVYALGFGNIVEVFDNGGTRINRLDFSSDVPVLNGQAANALRIGIDKYDMLYVGYSDGTIRQYDSNGNFSDQLTFSGSGNGQVVFPTGIAFDNQSDLIYVVDHGNYRVQVFGKQVEGPNEQSNSQSDSLLFWALLLAGVAGAIGVAVRYRSSKTSNMKSSAF